MLRDLEATEKRLTERIAHVEGAREATRLLYVVMIPFVGSLVVAMAIVAVNLYISFFVTPMELSMGYATEKSVLASARICDARPGEEQLPRAYEIFAADRHAAGAMDCALPSRVRRIASLYASRRVPRLCGGY